MDIFGGHHKTGLVLGVISMHLGSMYSIAEWELFWGVAKISNIVKGYA